MDRVSRQLLPWFVGLLAMGIAGVGQAIGADRSGIRIVAPSEVLRDFTFAQEGERYFVQSDGSFARLVTETDSPEIANRGDGHFHPVDRATVEKALEQIAPHLLAELECTIYLLPYPRAALLNSSADDRAIYLSPGVRRYSEAQIHFLVAHEIGHVFQRRHFPETDTAAWEEYRAMREIDDAEVFHDRASHAFQPREVFAEDFRVLFGSALAAGNGRIENPQLTLPHEEPGLAEFIQSRVNFPNVDFAETLSPPPSSLE